MTAQPRLAPGRRQWPVPAGLIALSLVPVLAGSARLGQLAGGQQTPANARFFDMPVPVIVHIVGATVFCLLGAFQFVPSLRQRRWHRRAGRVVFGCGLAAALSGMWMAVFYALPETDGVVLEAMRLFFGPLMAVALVLAVRDIRRREVAGHRAWMMRAYAIGLGAGTQVLTTLPWVLLFGAPGTGVRAVLMGAGWVINLAVAEYLIRRPRMRRSAERPMRAATASVR